MFHNLMVPLLHVPAVSRHVLQAGGGQMEELGAVCKRVLQMPKHGMQTVMDTLARLLMSKKGEYV